MKESQDKEIVIDDVKASTFEGIIWEETADFLIIIALLSYVYDRELEIKEDFAMDLYELTDKWMMKDLNKHCKEYLESNFTLQNVGRIAKRAEEIGSEELCRLLLIFW